MADYRVSSTLRFCVLLVLVLGTLGVSVARPVLALQEAELLDGSGVIVLPPVSFEAQPGTEVRELVQGKEVRGTCRFEIPFEAKEGDMTPQMVKMIAVQPDTCLAEIERGEPTTLPQADGSRRETASITAASGDVGAEGQNQNRQSTYWTIWEDPVLIRVATVRTSVRSKVQNKKIQEAKCTVLIDPFQQSGWQVDRETREFACNWTSRRATSVASAHFFNDEFLGQACSGRERTNVYVVRNTAKVTTKDETGVVQNSFANGGCANLLGLVRFFEPGVYYN